MLSIEKSDGLAYVHILGEICNTWSSRKSKIVGVGLVTR